MIEYLGIPMLFPVTWEENVAANMKAIPVLELFPGVLVKDIYKAYRYGLDTKRIQPWLENDADETTIFYLVQVTGKLPEVIRDCLNAMVLTVAQGKADRGILTGAALTGIDEKVPAGISDAATATGKAVNSAIVPIAVVGIGALLLYGMSIGILPKPKFKV